MHDALAVLAGIVCTLALFALSMAVAWIGMHLAIIVLAAL